MQISTNFAPSFKLIAPFFIIGVLVLLLSSLILFSFEVDKIGVLNTNLLAWVHLFLIGFVMMIILGAMAQLIPVVLEVEHFAVELYYVIYPLLLVGALLMFLGFNSYPMLLPFGGIVAFISFFIFLFETFLTLVKIKKIDFVTISVIVANIFLLIGLIIGVVLALGYSGIIQVDLNRLLSSHIYFVFIGYVGVTIMGISLVLLPMFWLSHSFLIRWIKLALLFLCMGVLFVAFSAIFQNKILEDIGYGLNIVAMILYLVQIAIIYLNKARVEKDIYLKSVLISFLFFVFSIIFAVLYMIDNNQTALLCIGWFSFGFILFLISGHLYKIIPFLVWYERFSPLVGKQKVPMLTDIVPVKSSNFQLAFSSLGWIGIAVSLLLQEQIIFLSSASLLFIGLLFLFKDVIYMINFKESTIKKPN